MALEKRREGDASTLVDAGACRALHLICVPLPVCLQRSARPAGPALARCGHRDAARPRPICLPAALPELAGVSRILPALVLCAWCSLLPLAGGRGACILPVSCCAVAAVIAACECS